MGVKIIHYVFQCMIVLWVADTNQTEFQWNEKYGFDPNSLFVTYQLVGRLCDHFEQFPSEYWMDSSHCETVSTLSQ